MAGIHANLLIHVIFGTRGAAPSVAPERREALHAHLAEVAQQEFGRALEIGGAPDHLHALLSLRPDAAPGEAVRLWKSRSAAWMRQAGQADFAWQGGFAAFSVSQSNAEAVARYIRDQAQHHAKLSFTDELKVFLQRHGIAFEESTLLE